MLGSVNFTVSTSQQDLDECPCVLLLFIWARDWVGWPRGWGRVQRIGGSAEILQEGICAGSLGLGTVSGWKFLIFKSLKRRSGERGSISSVGWPRRHGVHSAGLSLAGVTQECPGGK